MSTPEDHWQYHADLFDAILADVNESLEIIGANFKMTLKDIMGPNVGKYFYIKAMEHGIGHGREEKAPQMPRHEEPRSGWVIWSDGTKTYYNAEAIRKYDEENVPCIDGEPITDLIKRKKMKKGKW